MLIEADLPEDVEALRALVLEQANPALPLLADRALASLVTATLVALAIAAATTQMTGSAHPTAIAFRHVTAEHFMLAEEEEPFDLAVAIRVGALDGRHPEAGRLVLPRIRAALRPGGRIFIDGGNPLREIPLTGLPD